MAAAKAVVNSDVSSAVEGEKIICSSWVLQGGSLKTLARAMAQGGEAILDVCGFDGYGVAGMYYLRTLQLTHPELKIEFSHNTDHKLFRFGGGTSRAIQTATFSLMWFGKAIRITVDVVSGTLPLLLGREFGSEMNLIVDVKHGDVFTMRKGNLDLVSRNTEDGLISMSLLGELFPNAYKQALLARNVNVSKRCLAKRFCYKYFALFLISFQE